jgi:hypothetical protein
MYNMYNMNFYLLFIYYNKHILFLNFKALSQMVVELDTIL